MNPFSIAKNSWQAGDTREVEQDRLRKEIGVEYDSYRRIYIADGYEWSVVGQSARGWKKVLHPRMRGVIHDFLKILQTFWPRVVFTCKP
jgi:hypothetical protein